jgi:hypothetical protein
MDSRLGTFKSPFEARNYKKVILSIQKAKVLSTGEINILSVKVGRFLSKESIKKEKERIEKEVKGQFITGQDVKNGRLNKENGNSS